MFFVAQPPFACLCMSAFFAGVRTTAELPYPKPHTFVAACRLTLAATNSNANVGGASMCTANLSLALTPMFSQGHVHASSSLCVWPVQNLPNKPKNISTRDFFLLPQRDPIAAELSSFDYMDYWMNSIHAHTAKNTRDSVDNTTLSPPIFIVGTHRNSLHDAPELQEKLVKASLSVIWDGGSGEIAFTDGEGEKETITCHHYGVDTQFYQTETNTKHCRRHPSGQTFFLTFVKQQLLIGPREAFLTHMTKVRSG